MSVKELLIKNKQITRRVEYLLQELTDDDDYASCICNEIIDDVFEDVIECANKEWDDRDIKLAVGHVLCSRLGIEF